MFFCQNFEVVPVFRLLERRIRGFALWIGFTSDVETIEHRESQPAQRTDFNFFIPQEGSVLQPAVFVALSISNTRRPAMHLEWPSFGKTTNCKSASSNFRTLSPRIIAKWQSKIPRRSRMPAGVLLVQKLFAIDFSSSTVVYPSAKVPARSIFKILQGLPRTTFQDSLVPRSAYCARLVSCAVAFKVDRILLTTAPLGSGQLFSLWAPCCTQRSFTAEI